jgi:hypothetical protein
MSMISNKLLSKLNFWSKMKNLFGVDDSNIPVGSIMVWNGARFEPVDLISLFEQTPDQIIIRRTDDGKIKFEFWGTIYPGAIVTGFLTTSDGTATLGYLALAQVEGIAYVLPTTGEVVSRANLVTKSATPSVLTSDQNNYDFGTTSFLRLSGTALRNITGLLAGVDGQRLTIVNVGTFGLQFVNENGSSSAVNRFTMIGGSDTLINGDESIEFIYDSTSSRWRQLR